MVQSVRHDESQTKLVLEKDPEMSMVPKSELRWSLDGNQLIPEGEAERSCESFKIYYWTCCVWSNLAKLKLGRIRCPFCKISKVLLKGQYTFYTRAICNDRLQCEYSQNKQKDLS